MNFSQEYQEQLFYQYNSNYDIDNGNDGNGLSVNDVNGVNLSDLLRMRSWSNRSRMGMGTAGSFGSDNRFHLPRDMTFTSDSLITVICYSVLLTVGAAGNLTVFVTLFRARQRRSRVNRFIMHLSLADMIVVFIMMPLEIGWHVTVSWEAGDVACRVLMFFRAFGFYLSSFILIVISLDRVFTVTHPMKPQDAEHRGKVMLILSWIMSTVASLPQVSCFFICMDITAWDQPGP